MTVCSRAIVLLSIAIASASLLGQEADKPVSNKGRKPPAGLASIEDEHLTIYWSEEKDFLCGLSKALDEYDQIRIDPPATDEPTPLVIGHIAVWSDGKNFYAFSAKTAKWDTLKLPENSSPRLALANNLPVVTSGDKVFHFTAEAGKWAAHNAGATAQSDSALAAKSEAQESKSDPAINRNSLNGPTFVASLLLIKADWSQSPAAKEIEADLRKTLSGETVPADLLNSLPYRVQQFSFRSKRPRGTPRNIIRNSCRGCGQKDCSCTSRSLTTCLAQIQGVMAVNSSQ